MVIYDLQKLETMFTGLPYFTSFRENLQGSLKVE